MTIRWRYYVDTLSGNNGVLQIAHQDRNQVQPHATITGADLWTVAPESGLDDERAAIITTIDSARVAAIFTEVGKAKQSEMLQWISPIPYEDSHISARGNRTKGTGYWLLEHSRFSAWQSSTYSTILWLHGLRMYYKRHSNVVVSSNRILSSWNRQDEAGVTRR